MIAPGAKRYTARLPILGDGRTNLLAQGWMWPPYEAFHVLHPDAGRRMRVARYEAPNFASSAELTQHGLHASEISLFAWTQDLGTSKLVTILGRPCTVWEPLMG